MMMFRILTVYGLALIGMTAAITSASAQNTANGELIAKTWCAGCHNIEIEAPRAGASDAVPSFASIAQMSSVTETSLRVFLSTPHARMPDYNLTHDEIRDVSTYILSLRK
jgi:mono/diheme cytochrome c family protein